MVNTKCYIDRPGSHIAGSRDATIPRVAEIGAFSGVNPPKSRLLGLNIGEKGMKRRPLIDASPMISTVDTLYPARSGLDRPP